MSKSVIICNQKTYTTGHPRILVIKSKNINNKFQTKTEIEGKNIDLSSYINSKFLYVEFAVKKSLDKLMTNTINRRCRLHKQILENKLLLASANADMAAYILISGKRYHQ